jgi:ACS family hexuronate transporter-like MFS transporter
VLRKVYYANALKLPAGGARDSRAAARRTMKFRWWIATLLFASTTINYIDRQTLSALAPYLKTEYQWSNTDFAWIVIAFRCGYTIFQVVSGRLLDKLGTRRGLSLAVAWVFRGCDGDVDGRGLQELPRLPVPAGRGRGGQLAGRDQSGIRVVPEIRARNGCGRSSTRGSAVGGAIAPVLAIWLYTQLGSWRPAFIITGVLGLVWLVFWRRYYYTPKGQVQDEDIPSGPSPSWSSLLRRRETWGIILGKALTDPGVVLYHGLVRDLPGLQRLPLENTLLGFWVPFLAADLGNFAGGGLSSYWIKRGLASAEGSQNGGAASAASA